MKNLFKSSMLVAIVAATLVGCSKDTTETNAPVVKGTTIHFKAEVADDTDGSRASLTPNQYETLFTAAWENTDKIGIYADNGSKIDTNAEGTYKSDYKAFSATFTNCTTASNMWSYYAYYPYVDTVDAENNVTVPFGSARTQKGNAYNSAYDIMAADEFLYMEESATADPGKDAEGNPIIFAMHRLTAIAYFHFKTEVETVKGEEVVSVTLTVDEDKYIANNGGAKFCFTAAEKAISDTTGRTNTITITYEEGNRPTASDFTAWFNVLPVDGLSNLTIDIETTNHTAQFTRKSDVGAISYAAGKLYKVSTSIADTKWQEKAAEKSGYVLVTDASTLAAGDKIIIVEDSKAKAAGTLGSNTYLSAVDITITDNTIATLPASVAVFTLGGKEDEWTLTSAEGTLGATAAKKLAYGTGTTTWSISIDAKSTATIQNKNTTPDFGRFLYNATAQPTRFTTYTSETTTSMLLPKIYRAVGEVIETIGNPTDIKITDLSATQLVGSWSVADKDKDKVTSYSWQIKQGATLVAQGTTEELSLTYEGTFTANTEYVLYVKSETNKEGYKAPDTYAYSPAKSFSESGGEVVKGSTWQSLTFNSTAGSNAALFTTKGNTIDFSGGGYGAMNWTLTKTGTGTLGSDATRGVQLQQNAAVKMETTGYSGGVESITLGLSRSNSGNNTPNTLTVTVDGHAFTGTISCTTSVKAFTLTCTDGIIDATSKTISIEIGTKKSSTYISYIKIN